jgi:hypothetical protein
LKAGKAYLPDVGISVLGITDRKKHVQLRVNELVFPNGCYIPLKQKPYDTAIHTVPVIGNISYFEVDKVLSLYGIPSDKRAHYNKKQDYKQRLRNVFFQKSYLYIKDKPRIVQEIDSWKNHGIMITHHKREKIYSLLHKPLQSFIRFTTTSYETVNQIDEGTHMNIPTIDISGKELYEKLLKLFIDLLLNYSKRDYERFLQTDIDLTKIKDELNDGEYLVQYSDIANESYVDYFVRYSDYIRNVSIYNEGLSRSTMIQLHALKQKKQLTLEKIKEYPDIVHTLFGRGILVKNSELCDIDVITGIMREFIDEQSELQPLRIQSMLKIENKVAHRIDRDNLLILSKEFKIGFCLVTKQFTKKVYHEVEFAIDEHSFTGDIRDSEIIMLYQDDKYLYHILKKDKMSIPIKDITSNSFAKAFKKYSKEE